MENRKTFRVIIIGLIIYMLLSWIIVAGSFGDTGFTTAGFNQLGLFDFFAAPFQLFNYFVVTMTKSIDGYANQLAYGNIILAFIAIGILYGVLNKTGAYAKLVNDIKEKLKHKREFFLLLIAFIYCLLSAFTGLNLILFMLLPFIAAILMKLKYSRVTTFTATIGAMLIGQLGSVYNPTINGLNHVFFNFNINDNLVTRIILFLILVIILLATLFLSKNKNVDKEEEILLLDNNEKNDRSYLPIIIISTITTIILIICMYNWYYVLDNTIVTDAYNKVMDLKINGYNFMKNIFGMMEPFGYWSGFTMSALLLIESLILKLIYNIKMDRFIDGIKTGIKDMLPCILCSSFALILIVISLNNGDSFIYSIINNIFKWTENNQILGVFSTSILHNLFVNDYFALISSVSTQLTTVYGIDNLPFSLIIMQIGHGFISLITPFSVYLIAGLTFLRVPYTKWLKFIWKTLLIILGISIVVMLITKSFA